MMAPAFAERDEIVQHAVGRARVDGNAGRGLERQAPGQADQIAVRRELVRAPRAAVHMGGYDPVPGLDGPHVCAHGENLADALVSAHGRQLGLLRVRPCCNRRDEKKKKATTNDCCFPAAPSIWLMSAGLIGAASILTVTALGPCALASVSKSYSDPLRACVTTL